jgi:EAL domain-containing protein (putative c-di-GMP-specific phosphodiesterase class I)
LIDGNELQRSASIGIAFYPDDGTDIDTLIRKADAAMYRAKEQGRNQFAYFSERMNEQLEYNLKLEGALRQALARQEFCLRYQPQVNLVTGQIVGMEALVRWQRPDIGEVGPNDFISLAEETGLIVQLGEWVIQEACRQALLWVGLNLCVPVAVNVSATELRRGHVANMVADTLQKTGLAAGWLEVEITESGLIDDTEQTRSMLEHLAKLGVHLVIDDFGTGYSSFAYLRRFAVSQLKIDQSFVAGMTKISEDHAIVNAIIQLAKILRIPTLAEGVETEEQRQLLIDGGCQTGQGYLFAKPLLPEKATEALRKGYCG